MYVPFPSTLPAALDTPFLPPDFRIVNPDAIGTGPIFACSCSTSMVTYRRGDCRWTAPDRSERGAKVDRSPVESCDYELPRNPRKINPQCFQELTNSCLTRFFRSPLFSYDCALRGRGGTVILSIQRDSVALLNPVPALHQSPVTCHQSPNLGNFWSCCRESISRRASGRLTT